MSPSNLSASAVDFSLFICRKNIHAKSVRPAPLAGFFRAKLAAQTNSTDSLNNRISSLENQLSILKNLKITCFDQAQLQRAATAGIRSFAGGDFPANFDNRVVVRAMLNYKLAAWKFVAALVNRKVSATDNDSKKDFIGRVTCLKH